MPNLGQRAIEGTRLLMLSLGLLVLRLAAGGMMVYGHGWDKLANFGEKAPGFFPAFGLSSTTSLALAVFAEVFCSILVIVGLATRFAAVPLIVTMVVAGFLFHADDPFVRKELAFLYLATFVTLALSGPGLFSLDTLIGSWWRKKPTP